MLVGDGRRNFVGVLFKQLLEAEHDPRAFRGRSVTPCRKGSFGRRNRLLDRGLGCHGNVPRKFTSGGVIDRGGSVVVGDFDAVD